MLLTGQESNDGRKDRDDAVDDRHDDSSDRSDDCHDTVTDPLDTRHYCAHVEGVALRGCGKLVVLMWRSGLQAGIFLSFLGRQMTCRMKVCY